MPHTHLLNISLANLTQADLLDNLKKGILLPINVDLMVKLQKDREFYDIVQRADYVVCDSKILYVCSKITKYPLQDVIPGSSFFPAFYEYHKDDANCRIFLLGGMDGVAATAMERINEKVGRKIVVGSYSPSFGFEKKEDECQRICKMINESGANVVGVGVGCPKQEKWIDKYKSQMPNVNIWMAIGATIDFEAKKIKRAPKFFQILCLEWFYRLLQEPKRMFKRYFQDLMFFWYFLKQLFGCYKNPFDK